MTQPADRADDELPAFDRGHADGERWADWPCCPDCGRRRRTRCPTCDLGSDEFLLAEYLPVAESLPAARGCSSCGTGAPSGPSACEPDFGVLLMCPACDEAFSPQFYRLCEQCGHDFGDGTLVQAADADRVSDRALLVLAGLIALGLAMLAWFWYLFA
jgi:hypothetical protein